MCCDAGCEFCEFCFVRADSSPFAMEPPHCIEAEVIASGFYKPSTHVHVHRLFSVKDFTNGYHFKASQHINETIPHDLGANTTFLE